MYVKRFEYSSIVLALYKFIIIIIKFITVECGRHCLEYVLLTRKCDAKMFNEILTTIVCSALIKMTFICSQGK